MAEPVRDTLAALAGVWVQRAAELRAQGLTLEADRLERLAADVGEALATAAPTRTDAPAAPAAPAAGGLLTPRQAAQWLGVSLRKVYTLPIRVVKIGRCARYDVRDLQAFADLHGDHPRLERSA